MLRFDKMLKNRYLNIYESLDFDVKVFRNRDFEDSGVIRDRAAGDAGKLKWVRVLVYGE